MVLSDVAREKQQQQKKPDIEKKNVMGQVRWLTPVITALWEAKVGNWLSSGVWNQPGQHGKTLSLLKIQKNYLDVVACTCSLSYLGGWSTRISRTQVVEVVVSRDHATALQPGWQSKSLDLLKNKNHHHHHNKNLHTKRFQCHSVHSECLAC